jgi:hypothetical protein
MARIPDQLLGGRKVGVRALPRRVEVEEDDVLGGDTGQDRVAEHLHISFGIEAAQQVVEGFAAGGDPLTEPVLDELERVERGEALQLDEPGHDAATFRRDREIGLGKERMLVGSGNVERGRHGCFRVAEVLGKKELLPDLLGRHHHGLAQVRRKEDRRLADPKADRAADFQGEARLVLVVRGLAPGRVERSPQALDHGRPRIQRDPAASGAAVSSTRCSPPAGAAAISSRGSAGSRARPQTRSETSPSLVTRTQESPASSLR